MEKSGLLCAIMDAYIAVLMVVWVLVPRGKHENKHCSGGYLPRASEGQPEGHACLPRKCKGMKISIIILFWMDGCFHRFCILVGRMLVARVAMDGCEKINRLVHVQ